MPRIEVVPGAESLAFLLAAIDHDLIVACTIRDANLATAHSARINGAPMVAHIATSRARYQSHQIDRLLEKRLEITEEAQPT